MAVDGFTQMIDDSNAFLQELAQNNTKAWFNPRKDHYNQNIKKPATFFGQVMAEEFSRIAQTPYQPKLFRIYRDVRFSKDKTPLNAHLHILWRQPGDNPFAPAFFFGLEPGDMSIGFGVMGLKGQTLTRFRAFVSSWGDAFEEAIQDSGMTWRTWGGITAQACACAYAKDHPHAEMLKRKSMVLGAQIRQDWRGQEGGLVRAVRDRFERAMPLAQLLNDKLAADG